MKRKPIFEHETCGRCGGTGEYSFNQLHGTVCYGCGGSGVKLTKRGAAAQARYSEMCSIRADELKPGDQVLDKYSGRWETVERVGKSDSCFVSNGKRTYYFQVLTDKASHGTFPDAMFRVRQSDDKRRELVARALEYQTTLTKSGKPRKRASTH